MTKVWNDMHRRVEEACDKSIKDLQCDYVDMYFIHWPFPNYHAPGCDVDSEIRIPNPSVWRSLWIHTVSVRRW